ncbi:hypothetical protein ACFLXU_03695 [Chloroflexota bacterium]
MEMRIRTYLTLAQVEQLEEIATNLRDRLLIRFLFRLGCRVSEALSFSTHNSVARLGRRLNSSDLECSPKR